MIVYTDGSIEAREIPHLPGWVELTWLYPGDSPQRFARGFYKAQQQLKVLGKRGWLTWSESDHFNMHRHIKRVGGQEYARESNKVFFKKELV